MPVEGWYADPTDPARERFWSGTGWTHDTRPLPDRLPAGPVEPTDAGPARTGWLRGWRPVAAAAVAAAVAVGVGGAVLWWPEGEGGGLPEDDEAGQAAVEQGDAGCLTLLDLSAASTGRVSDGVADGQVDLLARAAAGEVGDLSASGLPGWLEGLSADLQRFEQALGTVDGDAFAAASDLDVDGYAAAVAELGMARSLVDAVAARAGDPEVRDDPVLVEELLLLLDRGTLIPEPLLTTAEVFCAAPDVERSAQPDGA